MKLPEFRKRYPQYDDLTDSQLAEGLYHKYYSDMDRLAFKKMIGLASDNVPAPPPGVVAEPAPTAPPLRTEAMPSGAGEASKSVEDDFIDMIKSKKKSGIKYTEEVELAETGQIVTIEKDVSKILREIDIKAESYKKLLDCLAS